MNINIRPAQAGDIDFILALNETNVEVLSPMDEARFAYFMEVSDLFQVAEVDGTPAAFLIALREGIPDYTSENYKWFSKTNERFLYVDRVVIDEAYRGLGLGRRLYLGVFDRAIFSGVDTVTAEIDTVPYNETSLAFHKAMGFEEVGEQVIRGGAVQVSLQRKAL